MSKLPIKVGFVGLSETGWASGVLGLTLTQPALADRYRLTAVSTTSDASATASAKRHSEQLRYPIKAFHGDTAQIANDPDVDLVAVAVRAPHHKAAILPAIEAGKDVFAEWPVGNGLRESIELAGAARKKGIRTMVGLQGRQSPIVKKVKEIIDSGKIGKILSVSIIALAHRDLYFWSPQVLESSAYTADVNSGATLLDIAMGHQLDMFTHILGDFASVSATIATHYPTATLFDSNRKSTGRTVPVTAPDQVAFTGLLKSGAVSTITWRGGLAPTRGRGLLWEIDGEAESIRLEGQSSFIHITDPDLYVNGELVKLKDIGGIFMNPTAAWGEFAKGEGGEYPTFEDALRTHRLLAAINRSAKEGRTIFL